MTSEGKSNDNLTGIPGQVAIEEPKKKPYAERKAETQAIMAEEQAKVVAEIAEQQAVDGELVNRGGGRPSIYEPELADEIIAQVAMGKSIRTICRDDRMPSPATFFNWLRTKPEFLEQYTLAKADSADMMLEDIMDISDDAQNDYMEVTYGDQSILRLAPENIQRSKLRVETRKWAMSKLQPKKYGDKLDVTSGGKELPTPLLAGLVDTNDDIKDEDES